MLRFRRLKIAAVCLAGWSAIVVRPALAEPAVARNFDGPEKAWRLMSGPAPAQILTQENVPGGVRNGAGVERVVVAAPLGQSAYLVCPIPPVAVLDELQVRLWVNSSRPDIQLGVRVVLPRSLDAQRKEMATTILRGTAYNRPNNWQELRVAEVPRLLADQVRVMRAKPGASIDPHQAYIDAIVLLVPGNPGGADFATDDLTVDGVLVPPPAAVSAAVIPRAKSPAAARQATAAPRSPLAAKHGRTSARTVSASTAANARVPQPAARENILSATQAANVRLRGTMLYVDGRPFLPRGIQWNGEPLQFLASCGFNVVQLSEPPTTAQSAEAERAGLWFVSIPPHPDAIARNGVGRPGDRVIAWQLRDEALEVDPNYAMRWAEAVRERDAVFGRPVLIMPVSNWAAINKAADILVARNPRSGPVRPLEYLAWIETCPKKAQPGTPLWIAISTQTDEAIQRQISALSRVSVTSLVVDSRQLESHVQIACAHDARGFLFQSSSPLNGTDEGTQQRAAALQLINRRLQLIEPWLAGGKMVAQAPSTDGVEIGLLLHVDRARLLVPLPNERAPQARVGGGSGRAAAKETVFVVPGIPETSQVFYFSPTTMRALGSTRIAGGTRLSIPAAGGGYVVMTEDPQVIQSLQQRVARDGARTLQLERELAARRARALASSTQRLAAVGVNAEIAARATAAVNQQLAQVDSQIAAGRLEQAHDAIAILLNEIDRATADQRLAIAPNTILESNPLDLFSDTLPEFASLHRSLGTLRPGDNLLFGGDFESLAQMTQQGWQHLEAATPSINTSAQLSATHPQQGVYCLDLSAAPAAAAKPTISADLVSIVSPAVPVDQGKLVEISGWVRVDSPFVGGDGLEIEDSLGGPGLSLLVSQTSGWQPFRMIRVAPEPAQLRLTFTLTGLGAAKVDAVMIRTMEQPVARRLPAVGATSTRAAANIGPGGTPGLLAPPPR
jgi:hypothetical protein